MGARYKGLPAGAFANAAALSQPSTRIHIRADGSEYEGPGAGVVRMAREELTAEVVTHEMVHMGLAIYRWSMNPMADEDPEEDAPAHLSLADMANEEILAGLIGELTQQAVDKLYDLGAWGHKDG